MRSISTPAAKNFSRLAYKMKNPTSPERFDGRFFSRFYYSARTRVAAPIDYLHRARLLAAYTDIYPLRVRRILDAGAGAGYFLRALDAVFPGSRGEGIEVSRYACDRYGWTEASIATFIAKKPYDLVVCHDVLQYLPRAAAAAALCNFGALCCGLLYFTVLTREDWALNCDPVRTDRDVYLRSARWYRRYLQTHFRQLGAGVYLARSAPATVFALDELARTPRL